MARRRYFFNLSSEERRRLEGVVRKGKSPARAQFKARILLLSDASERGAKRGGGKAERRGDFFGACELSGDGYAGSPPVACRRPRRGLDPQAKGDAADAGHAMSRGKPS